MCSKTDSKMSTGKQKERGLLQQERWLLTMKYVKIKQTGKTWKVLQLFDDCEE
jgi:hypothetical protein